MILTKKNRKKTRFRPKKGKNKKILAKKNRKKTRFRPKKGNKKDLGQEKTKENTIKKIKSRPRKKVSRSSFFHFYKFQPLSANYPK